MSRAQGLLKALFRPPRGPGETGGMGGAGGPGGPGVPAVPVEWPEGKRFAFTIVDDTDTATLARIRPVYELLQALHLRTTKTVWMEPTEEPEAEYNRGDAVSDPAYKEFVLQLQARGFEIGFHSARGGSSDRERMTRALADFEDVFGHAPKVHVNHAFNRENLYSGPDKLGLWPLRVLYRLMNGDHFEGHRPGSPYFWGDLAAEKITYVRDFHFDAVDVLQVYPRVPYRDPRRPYVPFWFHASDGASLDSFRRLLRGENLDALEEGGGLCIVYTHLGKDFCREGRVDPGAEACLRDVAGREGWFAPVGEVLDYLRGRYGEHVLSSRDRAYQECAWIAEKLFRGRT